MNKIDKFAIWCFGILVLIFVADISTILEFGDYTSYLEHLDSFGWFFGFKELLRVSVGLLVSTYLFFVYPFLIILRKQRSKKL